jgi:hypothetical protein
MSADSEAHRSLRIQPAVSYPRSMTVGQRHVIEVDLRSDTPPAQWRWSQEEFAFCCMLYGGDKFLLHTVDDGSVVVHRFGGSYGPAAFIAVPLPAAEGAASLWLTVLNPNGVPVSSNEFEVKVEGAGRRQEPVVTVPDDFPELVDLAAGVASPWKTADDADLFAQVTGSADPAGAIIDQPPDRRPAEPTDEAYELVALDQRRGKVDLHPVPLFAPGALPGQRTELTMYCGPSDEEGTIFPVVARRPRADEFRLVSLQSAKVPPGTYQMQASLVDRDQVRFSGLPAPVRPSSRSWESVIRAVPDKPVLGPVHVVLAIEISGPQDLIRNRISTVDRLVRHVGDAAADEARFTVISYGPHSVNDDWWAYPSPPRYPEVPPVTLAQADSYGNAQYALDTLYQQGGAQRGYTRAAQLECVLTDLARSLDGRHGRPVLVTAGSRPAHPVRVDTATEIIPCRRRNSWQDALRQLREYPGIAFGAINESGQASRQDPMWRDLGRDARARVDDFDEMKFAANLSLPGGARQQMPMPLVIGWLPPGSELGRLPTR